MAMSGDGLGDAIRFAVDLAVAGETTATGARAKTFRAIAAGIISHLTANAVFAGTSGPMAGVTPGVAAPITQSVTTGGTIFVPSAGLGAAMLAAVDTARTSTPNPPAAMREAVWRAIGGALVTWLTALNPATTFAGTVTSVTGVLPGMAASGNMVLTGTLAMTGGDAFGDTMAAAVLAAATAAGGDANTKRAAAYEAMGQTIAAYLSNPATTQLQFGVVSVLGAAPLPLAVVPVAPPSPILLGGLT